LLQRPDWIARFKERLWSPGGHVVQPVDPSCAGAAAAFLRKGIASHAKANASHAAANQPSDDTDPDASTGGFDGVGLAKLMSDAGLTLGGLYKHFASRDRLVAEAMSRAFSEGAAWLRPEVPSTSSAPLSDLLDVYLTPAHRDDAGGGCPVAALATDAARTPAARKNFNAGFRAFADWVGGMLDGPERDKRARGAAVICAMAGAVAIARALDDPKLSDEMLQATRRLIENALKGELQSSG
jgi:TetR/AcrR family transcriptional repressor of nem operon